MIENQMCNEGFGIKNQYEQDKKDGYEDDEDDDFDEEEE